MKTFTFCVSPSLLKTREELLDKACTEFKLHMALHGFPVASFIFITEPGYETRAQIELVEPTTDRVGFLNAALGNHDVDNFQEVIFDLVKLFQK